MKYVRVRTYVYVRIVKMAEGGGDLSKVSGGDGGKEEPDPKPHHGGSAKSGKKVCLEKEPLLPQNCHLIGRQIVVVVSIRSLK